MASVSRTAQFTKLHKTLKRVYKPVPVDPKRPVLEHLLFACCLEDARYEEAEGAFAALVHTFFDWNEVRVSSIAELAEVMAVLPDPRATSNRIKRVLHGVFEAGYSFDLEVWRKKNIGQAAKWMEKVDGTTRFTVAYTVQAGLAGHSIPIDDGTMRVLRLLDLVGEKEAAAGEVPGLERAIPKSKGIEFGSLLHQLGADVTANPYAPTVRDILLQISPEIEDRLPKRRAEKDARKPAETPAEAAAPATQAAAGKKKGAEPAEADRAQAAQPEKDAGEAKKKPAPAKPKPAAAPDKARAERPAAAGEAPGKSVAAGIAKRKPR